MKIMEILVQEDILSHMIKAGQISYLPFKTLNRDCFSSTQALAEPFEITQETKAAKFDKEEKFPLINYSATNKYIVLIALTISPTVSTSPPMKSDL